MTSAHTKTFYGTHQSQEFQDSLVALILITEAMLGTGRERGKRQEVQPEDKGNKEAKGKVHEPFTH